MNWPTAFAIVGIVGIFFGGMFWVGVTSSQSDAAIAIACVSSGGEWRKPNWYANEACLR